MRAVLILLASALCAKAGVTGDVHLRSGTPDTIEERAFQAAARCFQAGHWATAAGWLDEFAQRHADSPRRTQAVLMRAQALYQLADFNKAASELSRGENAAGNLAGDYLYWKAECRLALGQFDAAAAHLRDLLRAHPGSDYVLPANVALAAVSAQKEDWAAVVQLLRPTEGAFQKLAAAQPHSSWAQEGRLLLAQALFEQQDWSTAAEEVGRLPASTDLNREWRRLFLLAKLEHRSGKTVEALATTERVAELARQTGQTNQLAQVFQFRAAIHESVKNLPAALKEYARMQGEGMPSAQKREGLLRSARLHLQLEDYRASIQIIDKLSVMPASTNVVGTLDCLAGEIEWLRHGRGEPGAMNQALARFKRAGQSRHPQIQGRAKWGEGWCRWAEGDHEAARDAWQQSLELLGDSPVAPWARVQLARTHAQANQHAAARALLEGALPDPLRDLASQLALRSALAMGDHAAVEPLLEMISRRDAALLAQAQARLDAGEWPEAQQVLARLNQDSPIKPEAELEAIREFVAKQDWSNAVAKYAQWLKDHPEHPLRAQVAFDQAWAQSMAGNAADAVATFGQIIEQHPGSQPALMARMWQADFWYNNGTNRLAEAAYKTVAGQTNAPPALRYRATLMAGRVAMARQGLDDARKEFSKLINDEKAPAQVRSDATFALGDLTVLEIGAAVPNSIAKLTQATNAFYNVIQASPTNAVAARAWGRIGDCCLLAAGTQPGYQEHARLAYAKAVEVPGRVSVAVRSQAHLGLAKALRRQARDSADREQKLTEAVDQLLTIVNGRHLRPGQEADTYWRSQAGLMAMELLEQLGKPIQALELCNRLIQDFPAMKKGLAIHKQRILEQLAKQK